MEQLKRDDTHDHAAAVRTGGSVPMPERLGEFRLLRELGRGGMGVVYEALQESLGRHVALKVIHHGHLDDRRRQRFTREAQAVAQLHHTNIVPIFAVGEHDGLPYYAMQYIAGRGLDAVVARWRTGGDQIPPPAERWRFVARIGAQAADALQFAHDQGVLHRDVKPANLLIDDQGAAWLTDFGLAKLVGQDDLTASGDVIGTLRYLAPEALHGATDHRGDVYSLGLTLYELLTLNPPFGDLSPSELLRHVSDGHPQRPRSFDPAIPRDLETIVLKAIAREPNDRYATAGAFADDLKAFLDDRPIRARRATPPERLWRWSRRNRALASLTAIAAGVLVLAAVVGWAGYVSTTRALQRADENVALSLAVFGELFDKLAPRDDSLPPPPGRHQRRPPPDGPRRIEHRRQTRTGARSPPTTPRCYKRSSPSMSSSPNATPPIHASKVRPRGLIRGSDDFTTASAEVPMLLLLTTAPPRFFKPSPHGFRANRSIPLGSSRSPSCSIPGRPSPPRSRHWSIASNRRASSPSAVPPIRKRCSIGFTSRPSSARCVNGSATRKTPSRVTWPASNSPRS